MSTTIKILITTTLIYALIVTIGCSPMGVFTHETLNVIGVDSQIALADVDGKDSYGHVYVIVDGVAYEPRYLGLYLQDNINYYAPYEVYDSTDEYVSVGYTVFPAVDTIIMAVMEL